MKNQRNNIVQHGDSGFTEEEHVMMTKIVIFACERILPWRTEGTYEVFRYVTHHDVNARNDDVMQSDWTATIVAERTGRRYKSPLTISSVCVK